MTKSCRLNSFQAEIATNNFNGIPLCDLRVYNSNGLLKTSVNIAARLRKPSRANNTPCCATELFKGVTQVNIFEHILHLALVFLLLTSNM